MIIDSHYHLDERMLGIEALIARVDAARVDRIACIATLNNPSRFGVRSCFLP